MNCHSHIVKGRIDTVRLFEQARVQYQNRAETYRVLIDRKLVILGILTGA